MIVLLMENNNILFRNKFINFFLDEWYSNNEFIKLQTSGSTGCPKIIYAKKQYLIDSAKRTGAFLNLKSGDSALCCLPLDFIAGKMMFIRALILNLKLYYITPTSYPIKYLNFPINFCAMTPMQVSCSLHKIKLIKKLIIGGSVVSEELKKELFKYNNLIYESFGMTETYSHFACKKLSQLSKLDYFSVLDGFSISQDKRGCLVVKTPFHNSLLVTNDVVKINHQTFKFLGRLDFMINSGGIKIFPEIIEKKIYQLGYINYEFIVSSVYDKQLGEKLILIIEHNIENNTEEHYNYYKNNILVKLKKQLNKYEVPKDIIFIKKFKRTINGKIIRKI